MSLAEVEAYISGLDPSKLAKLDELIAPQKARVWLPQPGPQANAFYCEADELLYGGAAGGGKSDLLIGLALTAHERSLVFRRLSTDLDDFWARLAQVGEPIVIKNDNQKKRMRTNDGRAVDGGHLEKPGSERSWMGRPHDLIAFDEGAQLDEYKVMFVSQWLRSTSLTQRKRLVIGTNPPIPEFINGQLTDTAAGDWLKRWFAPWLDDMFHDPAEDGELRWCFMRAEGDRFTTIWVPGPGKYHLHTGERLPDDTVDPHKVDAKSRTFIRSRRKDNVFLDGTGYDEKLSASPEPLRSLLMNGDFSIKGEDHPMQVIPTNWVLQANQRWKEREAEAKRLTQLVLSADIAQGGADTTIIASLLDTAFFEQPVAQPGRLTPTGVEVTQLLLRHRRDASHIVLDGTGGWGGSTRDLLLTHHNIRASMCVASKGSTSWTKDMQYKFGNIRAEMWWMFREALDPKSGEDICLPPNARLLAQLTAPMHRYRGNTIWIEEKDELRTRLGSSTDEADAVLQAWQYHNYALALRLHEHQARKSRIVGVAEKMDEAVELKNPLGRWS